MHYSFDQWTSGTTVINEGTLGSSLDATLSNSALVSTTSPPTGTQCLSLTASSSQYMSTSSAITLSGTDWAVCFWYNKSSSTVSETDVRIFDLSTALDTTTREITVGFNSSGSLYLFIGGGTSQTLCATSCCDGTWRHVAIVYNSSTSKYYFYFNGIMCTNSVASSTIGTIGSNISRSLVYIGKSILTTGNIYATVQIDDFRIYDNVLLTLTNIAQICGNCHLYCYQASTSSNVLLNTLLDCYLPSTTQATASNILTKYANTNVDLNSFYAKSSYGTSVIYNYKISTGADIGTIFNLCTADVTSVNNPVTNTLSCAKLGSYPFGVWGVSFGITFYPHPFTTQGWTNYWINYTSNYTTSNNVLHSYQQSYICTDTSPISATLVFLCDNYTTAIYVNKVNVLSSLVNSINTSLTITLYPGTNLIDFYCQNQEASGPSGLIYFVKRIINNSNVLLCQSDDSVKWRIV